MFIWAFLLVFTCVAQVLAQTVTPIGVGPWTYQGCFIDDPFRQLQHQQFVTGGMTVEACTLACKTAGFALAGLEFGSECWCDSFLQGTQQFADSQCAQMTCSGNSAETCGGPDRLQVYLDSSAAPPQTNVCVVTNSEDFSPIAVTKSTPATQTRLNLVDVGVSGTHAFLLTADTCPSCKVEGDVQLGALLVLSSLYPDAAFVEFFNATTGDSPIGRELFTPQTDVYCAQISPVTGRIGPLVVAANGHSDLWALCPNTTAGLRSDLVYSPVGNHPHYTLNSCQPVWLTMAWFDQVF
ncbi:WSC domain-containing protein [Mycena albidolilacea]|uniref:WSC domain-containing protein n=1 Tax=Mycena albidolilacea TaxID=1033008 RepID=A0AAD7AM47_9AGAR|nr:WSC domain-containing protein [Mycena albidolilacea]